MSLRVLLHTVSNGTFYSKTSHLLVNCCVFESEFTTAVILANVLTVFVLHKPKYPLISHNDVTNSPALGLVNSICDPTGNYVLVTMGIYNNNNHHHKRGKKDFP